MTGATGIAPVRDVDFTAEGQRHERGLTVVLTGNADLNVKAELDTFISAAHEEARKVRAEEVIVDVRQLEFMNSSCLKSLVWWISNVQDQPPEAQYRIVFLSSPAMYWQRRSLNALACLASDLVSVQA